MSGLRVGVVCSSHGFGHVGRQLATVEALLARGHEVVLVTAAPPALLPTGPRTTVVPRQVDVGIRQADSLSEDPEATRAGWMEAVARVDGLAEDLRGLDCAVVDVAPTALEACRRAGVPALAVGNFDWAWVYERYRPLAEFAPQMRAWHAAHPALALEPGPGMTGFAHVVTVADPLARRAAAHRPSDGGSDPVARVLVAFGGLGLSGLSERLPRLPGVRWVVTPPQLRFEREDVEYVEDVRFPALLAGADLVLTKPGYGVLAEARLAGVRLCWLDRGAFPEAPYLEEVMRARGDVKVMGDDVGAAVRTALAGPQPRAVGSRAAEGVADAVVARGSRSDGIGGRQPSSIR